MFLQAGSLGIFSIQEYFLTQLRTGKSLQGSVPGLAAFPQQAHQGSESSFPRLTVFLFSLKTKVWSIDIFSHHEKLVPAQL